MSDRCFLISSADHSLPQIVDDEDQPAVLGLRDYNALILWDHTRLEHQMSSLSSNDTLKGVRVILGSQLVRMDSGTVHNYLRFYRELLFLKLVKKYCSNDLPS